MKITYKNIHKPALLYVIIEELVFLEATKKRLRQISKNLSQIRDTAKNHFQTFLTNEWTKATLVLTGYMGFSSLLLFIAYKLVMVL
ncbi:MAG: hypothetical protein AAGF77_06390 [Bacteroidota bacterium]